LRAMMMRRPSRRTTRAPILPRIGSILGLKRTFAPGLGRGAAGPRWLVLGGRVAAKRASVARLGRGSTAGERWPDASRTVRGRFEVGSRGAWRRKGRQARPAAPAMARSLPRGERARWGRWPDPSGKLAGSFGDGSRTIRGGFEGRLAAEVPSGEAGGPRDGAEPSEGRARPVGTVAGTFGDGSGTVRGGFEGRRAAEAPSGQAGGPRDGAEPGEGRERPVGTVAGSFGEAGRNLRGRFEDDSRWIRGAPGGGSAVRPGRRPPRRRGARR
jgi:hypothetical protein